ncbi:DUF5134 domain-containing protein [Parafrankia soli]|uniref:DUF5134 domain-containing protein n=1 Tax=Parafrankia soli TaxID=2599596 RepID=A0A1S1Q668_9ACTN|nr:DUF5134 domain-containing protein [Parafrankia soli]OHV27684.1 DUF5134 domain-containing protein [Parafrankia soli]
MTHRHPVAADLVPLAGPLAVAAGVASIIVAMIHLWRMRALFRRPVAADGPRTHASAADGWIEGGHVLVAAGMAVMFTGPARLVGSWPFLALYLALTAALLVGLVTHPRCSAPGMWSCCALLVVEAAAMACMSGAACVAGWPLRTDGAIGAWCVVIFGGACLAALAGPSARRFAAPPPPRPRVRELAARLIRIFPEPVVPRGSRLIMSGGMILMLLART